MRSDIVTHYRQRFTAVTRLEASRGRNNMPVIGGAILGAVLGAVGGAIMAPNGNCPGGLVNFCPGEQTAGAIVAGTIIGGFAGGLLGFPLRKTIWQEVPLESLHVGVDARRGQIALRCALFY